ncbi:MAG: HepT-like ribonuclease domain-containing protein [Bacillota bacterium]
MRKKYDEKEFKNDSKVFASTELFLYLVIEALLDIGNYIISDKNLVEVEFYKLTELN